MRGHLETSECGVGDGDYGGDPDFIKVLDFGIAKIDTSDKTHTRELGTPKYMAPEQVRGQSKLISPATDTYALGHIARAVTAHAVGNNEKSQFRKGKAVILVLISFPANVRSKSDFEFHRLTCLATLKGFFMFRR